MNPDETEMRSIQRITPIPTKWVPVFMDSPSFKVAVKHLNHLVNTSLQQQLLDYQEFIFMVATAACARSGNSNVSTLAIAASRLV